MPTWSVGLRNWATAQSGSGSPFIFKAGRNPRVPIYRMKSRFVRDLRIQKYQMRFSTRRALGLTGRHAANYLHREIRYSDRAAHCTSPAPPKNPPHCRMDRFLRLLQLHRMDFVRVASVKYRRVRNSFWDCPSHGGVLESKNRSGVL